MVIGTIATTLLNFTSPEDTRGLISAALFTLAALMAIAYSAGIFVYRSYRLRERYADGLRYYYADAATRAFRAAGVKRDAAFVDVLLRTQQTDGGWRNAEPLVKEDDPLIATAFAVSALAFA